MHHIDHTSNIPLHRQLYEAIKRDIINRHKAGEKLPSIRKLATLYNLSKNTVETAYGQLYAEGFIESRPKSGYYVSDFAFETISTDNVSVSLSTKSEKAYRYDFFPAQLAKEDFPLKLWKRLTTKAITDILNLGSYHDGQGEPALRREITRYLNEYRGVACQAEQIIICHGFSDAMELLAKLLKEKYAHFGIEHPGYHVARRAFASFDYTIHDIEVDTQGLNLEALRASPAQVVYITPSHQYPTGVTMPIANRLQLLAYMHQIGGLIIEDDYDSEMRYINRPIPSLQGLDKYDSVVYMGTFAKSLSPALRVSYMVLPHHLLPLFKQSYDTHFPRVSLITQQTLAHFMAEGHYERHIRKIRTRNLKKHNLMKKTFQEKLGNTFEILSQGGGLALLIMPTVAFDWEKFNRLAEEKSIKLYYAKERCGGDFEALRMGFGGFNQEKLIEAIESFSEIWYQSILYPKASPVHPKVV